MLRWLRRLALAGAWLAVGCGPGQAPFPCAGCNLLLVSVDTLRADHLSLYGYARPTSPNLEALAEDAVVFERFFHSGGATLASHMSMFTALHPTAHGVSGRTRRVLPAQRRTLAEALSEAGYATAGFVDSGWMRGRFGFRQGFDLYDDQGGRFAAILPKAYAWLDEPRETPFFLFLHSYDVHSEWQKLPYECPGDYPSRYVDPEQSPFDGCKEGRCASKLLGFVAVGVEQGRFPLSDWFDARELAFMEGLYDGCINYVDDLLGALVEDLKRRGLYDRTLLVVTSDHGEQFGEHGSVMHGRGYEETVRIPLLMKLPGQAFAGRRVDALAAMVDLAPTLLEALALPPLPDAQGASLLPVIAGGRPLRDEVHMYAVLRTGRYKYFAEGGRLYDLAEDPGEQRDVADAQPGVARRLDGRLEALLEGDRRARAGLRSGGEPLTLAPEERRNLEALGYVEE